jgi:hypothetical protein
LAKNTKKYILECNYCKTIFEFETSILVKNVKILHQFELIENQNIIEKAFKEFFDNKNPNNPGNINKDYLLVDSKRRSHKLIFDYGIRKCLRYTFQIIGIKIIPVKDDKYFK